MQNHILRENGHFTVVGQLSKCKATAGQVTWPTGKVTTAKPDKGNRESQFPPVLLWPDLSVHTMTDKHLCVHIPAPTE